MDEHELTKLRTNAVIEAVWGKFAKYITPWLFTIAVILMAGFGISGVLQHLGLSMTDDPLLPGGLAAVDVVFLVILLLFVSWFAGLLVGELWQKIEAEKQTGKDRRSNDNETTQDN